MDGPVGVRPDRSRKKSTSSNRLTNLNNAEPLRPIAAQIRVSLGHLQHYGKVLLSQPYSGRLLALADEVIECFSAAFPARLAASTVS